MKSIAIFSAALALAQLAVAQSSTSMPKTTGSCATYLTSLDGNKDVQSSVASLNSALSAFTADKYASATSWQVSAALTSLCSGDFSESTIKKQLATFATECNDELTGDSPNADVRATYDSLYVLAPAVKAVCTKNDSNDYCAASIAPGSSSQVTAGSVASMYQGTSLPYLFIDPTASKDVVCTSCTKNILSAYTSFEMSTPYALGLSKSAILGGQQAIWQGVLDTCGGSFFAATGTGNAASGGNGGLNMGAGALGQSDSGAASTTVPVAALALIAGSLLLAL